MTEHALFLALRDFEEIKDADFELDASHAELLAKIERANEKRASGSEAIQTTQSLPDVEQQTDKADATEPGLASGEQIRRLLEDYVAKISAYHGLAAIVSAMGPVFVASHIKTSFHDKAQSFTEIEKKDGYTIYGLGAGQLPAVHASLDKMLEIGRGMKVLPESVLLSLVATFDSFIARIALGLLKKQPGRYDDDRKLVSVKSIMAMSSFDDVISMLAEEEVEDCMRGNHASQVTFLENLADVKIKDHYERWSSFVEIFERRNLVAHNRIIVNALYLRNCKDAGVDVSDITVGSTLKLDANYLISSANILLEFGILLLFVVWRKMFKADSDNAFIRLNEIAFNLIRKNYILVASRILEFGLFKQSRKAKDITIKMMVVNLANCYKKLSKMDKAEEVLTSMDWSSANAQFTISIAAVRDDVDEVVRLMPQVEDEKLVGKMGFRYWPVFDGIRSNDEFRKAFQLTFGEPLGAPEVSETDVANSSDPEPADEVQSSDGQSSDRDDPLDR